MGRREEREQAFNIVFSSLFQPEEPLEDIVKAETEAEAYVPSDYSRRLIKLISENLEEIDRIIENRTVRWKKERLSKVALSVLRISLCEILYFDEIPVSVSVNEAVELAKKYSIPEDAAFVNGLLGSYIREREGQNAETEAKETEEQSVKEEIEALAAESEAEKQAEMEVTS